MKKRHDVDELAKQLTTAVSTPLQKVSQPAPTPEAVATPKAEPKKPKKQKVEAIPVFLRLPVSLYERFDNVAVKRTKETGRGVSVQQIIIEKLESVQ